MTSTALIVASAIFVMVFVFALGVVAGERRDEKGRGEDGELSEQLRNGVFNLVFAMPRTLPFKRLHKDAAIPEYAHEGDSGMDVRSVEELIIGAYSSAKIRTGLACEIPDGYEIQVRPRSGLAAKKGIVAAFGTVDEGYRGEICVTLFNHSGVPFRVESGMRIAQFVLSPVARAYPVETTDALSETERGAGGFGSTGA